MTTFYTEERVARLTRRIEEYRAAKQRQFLERAMKLWRQVEANRRRAALAGAPPERTH